MSSCLTGLIPAAGMGIRISPHSLNTNKTLLKIGETSIIERNVAIMRDSLGISNIYVLIGYKKEDVVGCLNDGNRLGVKIRYVEVRDIGEGLASGILEAEKYIDGRFCVILGDEFYSKSNHHRLSTFLDKDFDAVCAVKDNSRASEIKKNYSVEIREGRIRSLVEKPSVVKNHYLGCGTYLFTKEIFAHIRATPPSPRTRRIELTEVLNAMAEKGKAVYPFFLEGDYVNINSPDEYNEANYIERSANFGKKTVSLIIPAYNEEMSIGHVIDDFRGKVDEIIIVNNSSRDRTEEISKDKGATVFTGTFGGYGDALKFGMDKARGDILVLTEADGSFFARDLGKILEYLKDADMVLGTRTTKQMIEQAANMNFLLRWGNVFVAKLIELLWLYKKEPRLTDIGCTYRGIWRSAYLDIRDCLESPGPEFSPDMIIEAMRHNKRTIEIPITYSGRISGESKFSKSIFSVAKTAARMLKLIFKKKFSDLMM